MHAASSPVLRRTATRTAVVALTLVAALGLAGCGTEEAPGSGAVEPTSSAAPVVTSTPTHLATPTPTATTPAAVPEPTGSTAPTLKQRLLAADAVPGLNARWEWQDGKTRPARPGPFGVCARTDLASIGATEVLERTFYPPDDSDDNAAQQIATFADATSTAQAWSVLGSWRTSCGADRNVRELVTVAVPTGQARWYLVSWEPDGEESGRFEALGMVRNGTRISVLRITNSGQDYNYPVGSEPMVGMVRAAAALLAD